MIWPVNGNRVIDRTTVLNPSTTVFRNSKEGIGVVELPRRDRNVLPTYILQLGFDHDRTRTHADLCMRHYYLKGKNFGFFVFLTRISSEKSAWKEED